jgi:hypothetical protein
MVQLLQIGQTQFGPGAQAKRLTQHPIWYPRNDMRMQLYDDVAGDDGIEMSGSNW